MAQTAPPVSGEASPRPLPRGGRPTRSRDARPRFQALDSLWMALLAATFAGVTLPAWRGSPLSTLCLFCGVGVVVLTYLLGWRAAGRPAGVMAGLLLATSGAFAGSIFHAPQTALFALLTLAALFAFVAGSSLAALALAAGSVWLRADGIALGVMLLAFTLVQHRRRALWGALLFCLPTLAAMLIPHAAGGHPFAAITAGFRPALLTSLAAPATLFVSWFLLPFLGEMADPVRRARWLPVVAWALLYAVLASALAFGPTDTASAALVPFLPLWFLFAGAGLARLLPVLTGDLPILWLRYVVATLAVLSLVALRARMEWVPVPRSSTAPAPGTAPAQPVPTAALTRPRPSPATTPRPLKPALPRPLALSKAAKPAVARPVKPQAAQPQSPKPAVPQYVIRNGRKIRRSKWAIQWDLTHPHR